MRVLAAAAALATVASAQTVLDSYGFETAAVTAGTVCDTSSDAAHALTQNAGEAAILEAGQFGTYYADTLCADGTQAMHVCSGTGAAKTGGASIGVMDGGSTMIGPAPGNTDYSALTAAEGTKFYEIMARGVDGFTYVCFEPTTLTTAGTATTASIQYYVAQAGWHEEPDRLRVWAETTLNGVTTAASLLPQDGATCVEEVHKHNIDKLMMRDSGTDAAICTTGCDEWMGGKNIAGDPSLMTDRFLWKTMTADLGPADTVKVCAGLQTGAGHELLWLDDFQLVEAAGQASTAACPMTVPDYANPPRIGAAVAFFPDYDICCADAAVTCPTCDRPTRMAESTCKSTNACTVCSDFNYGDDCDSNGREHCSEIECCPTCEAEIRAMFACEHGASCPASVPLTCAAATPAVAPAPTVSSATSGAAMKAAVAAVAAAFVL